MSDTNELREKLVLPEKQKEAFSTLAKAIMEVPTGVPADQHSRNANLKIQKFIALLEDRAGLLQGVYIDWVNGMQPIAEAVFGTDLNGHKLGEHKEYSATIFDDIEGRIHIISTDEMWGPTLSLDLTAENSKPK